MAAKRYDDSKVYLLKGSSLNEMWDTFIQSIIADPNRFLITQRQDGEWEIDFATVREVTDCDGETFGVPEIPAAEEE